MAALLSCCDSSIHLSLQRSCPGCTDAAEHSASSSRTYLRVSSSPTFASAASSRHSSVVWENTRRNSLCVTAAIGPSGLGPVPADEASTAVVKEPETAVKETDTSVQDLKETLVDSLYGTERGLRASSETRGEIVEIIAQLEAKNPTAAPTEAVSLLNGKWNLAYTSFSELFPLLAAGNLPLVKVGENSETFDATAFTIQNTISFTGPLATTSFSNSGSFKVRSSKRLQPAVYETCDTAAVSRGERAVTRREVFSFAALSVLLLSSDKAQAKDIPFFGIRKQLENAEKAVETEVKELAEQGEKELEAVSASVKEVVSDIESGPSVSGLPPTLQAGGVVAAELVAVLLASTAVNGLLRVPSPK